MSATHHLCQVHTCIYSVKGLILFNLISLLNLCFNTQLVNKKSIIQLEDSHDYIALKKLFRLVCTRYDKMVSMLHVTGVWLSISS